MFGALHPQNMSSRRTKILEILTLTIYNNILSIYIYDNFDIYFIGKIAVLNIDVLSI